MPQLDLEKTLRRIKENQWALADIDWDAPGREMITEEQWPKLKAFMADLTWIEHIGARGFAAMAKKAPNDTLKEIYTWFHAEEQRHANAELALMQRAMDMTLAVHQATASMLYEGIDTREVEAFIAKAHQKVGASGSYFVIVLFGVASSFPHGVKEPQQQPF